jgi:hypothetical protein
MQKNIKKANTNEQNRRKFQKNAIKKKKTISFQKKYII